MDESEGRDSDADAAQFQKLVKQGHIRWRKDIDTWLADSRIGADSMNRDSRRHNAPRPDPVRALEQARGAPIRALELLDGGLLEVRAGLSRDLDELLAGGDPIEVAARWKEIGRADVSMWLTDILSERLRESVAGGADTRRRGAAPAGFSHLLPMLDLCLEVRGGVQARSNANEQLTLERLALGIAAQHPGAVR